MTELKMRFINCPNCLSSHSDEHSERELSSSSSSYGHHSLKHRKFGRLHNFTKALFSPTRLTLSGGGGGQKSKEFICYAKNACRTNSPLHVKESNRLERRYKVKKRDLVKPCQHQTHSTGKYSWNQTNKKKKTKQRNLKLIISLSFLIVWHCSLQLWFCQWYR